MYLTNHTACASIDTATRKVVSLSQFWSFNKLAARLGPMDLPDEGTYT